MQEVKEFKKQINFKANNPNSLSDKMPNSKNVSKKQAQKSL